jgi:signal transduction histidine kinase
METLKEQDRMAGGEILIVEDSLTQAEQLRYILEKHDFRVSTAANGREALSAISKQRPLLIISDIVMPEMDGYELCREVKADAALRDIPVILLTALSDPRDVIRGIECGADSFITKPYDEEYLISGIRQIQTDQFYPVRENSTGGLELNFGGQDHVLNADCSQILKLLLSSYEMAMRKNRELVKARDEMNELNDQLKAANSELESFSFTVSHDLRSPLNVIGLYCQLIMEISGGGDSEFMDYVKGILSQVDRMNQLITTLLNFSQLTRSEMRRTEVDLSTMAREIALDLSIKQPERKVAFNIADGMVVHGDARLLRVVLENLLGNAWKYTGREAQARIEFGMEEAGGETVYFVRDNGTGFDMSQADRLFNPFRRLHDEAEFEGTGIGLATVRKIIERHGGKVWAEGEVGKGAVFYFTL